jgi:hypothetical protein
MKVLQGYSSDRVTNSGGGLIAMYRLHFGLKKADISSKILCRVKRSKFSESVAIPCSKMVQKDVEDYDYHVLKQLNFDRFKPRIIRMEWCNLLDIEKEFSLELLKVHGYRVKTFQDDLLAWRKFWILSSRYSSEGCLWKKT